MYQTPEMLAAIMVKVAMIMKKVDQAEPDCVESAGLELFFTKSDAEFTLATMGLFSDVETRVLVED